MTVAYVLSSEYIRKEGSGTFYGTLFSYNTFVSYAIEILATKVSVFVKNYVSRSFISNSSTRYSQKLHEKRLNFRSILLLLNF